MSPAALHLVCANLIGRKNVGFALDVDASAKVWNQPSRSYEFVDVATMAPDAAALKFFNTTSYSASNTHAKRVQYVKNVFKYIVEPEHHEDGPLSLPAAVDKFTETRNYEYLLELDNANNIIGGEWVGESRYTHPDFIWFPLNKPADNFVTETGISYAFVKSLIAKSRPVRC